MATKAEKLLAKGQGLEKKGKRDKALEIYRDACKQAPYDPDVWTVRAETAFALGMSGEAAEALFHVSDLFARGGMPLEALRTARRVLEIDASHGGARRFVRMLEARLDIDEEPAQEPAKGNGKAEAVVPEAAVASSPIAVEPVAAEPVEPSPEAAAPEPPLPSRLASESGAVSVHIEAEPPPPPEVSAPIPVASPPTSERLSRATMEVALDSISLGGEAGRSTDIPIDDGAAVDVVRAVASTISSSPLLSELDSELIRILIEVGTLVHRPSGETVVRQGEIGTSLYLILGGEVAVEREGDGAARELARLKPGAFFGEMALLTNMPRSATVRAVKTTDLLEISRRDVRALIDRDPRILKLLMRFFRARLVGTLLQTSSLFNAFSRDERRELVSRFRLREIDRDFVVIHEGKPVEGLYLVLVGSLEVAIQDTAVAQLGPGDVFGEMSLLDDTPASATVKTTTRSWVLLLGRGDFEALVEQHPEVKTHLREVASSRRDRNRATLAAGKPSVSEGRLEPV